MRTETALETRFYEILNDGFIYDEDENGQNMSYGEYVAIAEELNEAAISWFEEAEDLEDLLERLSAELDSEDDVKMFAGLDIDSACDWDSHAEYYGECDEFTEPAEWRGVFVVDNKYGHRVIDWYTMEDDFMRFPGLRDIVERLVDYEF